MKFVLLEDLLKGKTIRFHVPTALGCPSTQTTTSVSSCPLYYLLLWLGSTGLSIMVSSKRFDAIDARLSKFCEKESLSLVLVV